MDRPKTNPVSVITIGLIVLVLFSICLFWARFICETTLLTIMPEDSMRISISPSGLVPVEIEKGPNADRPSEIRADMDRFYVPFALGIADYLARRTLTGNELVGPHLDIYEYNNNGHPILHFDRTTGLLVYRYRDVEKLPDGGKREELVELYAGPEGVAETPEADLGRFIDLLDSDRWYTCPVDGNEPRMWTTFRLLYDKKLRQFFAVDFREGTVRTSPALPSDPDVDPVQLGRLSKPSAALRLDFSPPLKGIQRVPDDSNEGPFRGDFYYLLDHDETAGPHTTLVLDESGRIDVLDLKTLQFAGTVGHLPAPRSAGGTARPKDLFAYDVLPVTLGEPIKIKNVGPRLVPVPSDKSIPADTWKFAGTCVAAVSRDRTVLKVAVHDSNGILITEQSTPTVEPKPSYSVTVDRDFFDLAWGSTVMITKFVLENLQPPALSIASYFTADTFEAVAGHRVLFLLPNSFVAMKARDAKAKAWDRGLVAGLLMAPSIVLALFLCWLVKRDAVTIGLSENARGFWFVFTFAFGIAGYLTYLLTRPKIALVTCQSCGRGRRPDMGTCHRCGSKWIVPELTPPAWRVIEEQTSTEDAADTQRG